MIGFRFYNIRSLKLALILGKRQHNTVYYIKEIAGSVVAVEGVDLQTIELIPTYYTEYMFFWSKKTSVLVDRYKDRLIFTDIPGFLQILGKTS